MPEFQFKAIDSRGRITSGNSTAQNPENLAAILHEQGLFLMETKETTGLPPGAVADRLPTFIDNLNERMRRKKVAFKELTLFTAQLAVMVRSALPILESLQLLAAQTTNPTFKAILIAIGNGVSEGEPLSVAFSHFPEQFDEVYVSLLAAGEAGGDLDVMLDRLAMYMDFKLKLKQKIQSALLYPLIVIATALMVIAFLVVFVLPTFLEVFIQLNIELPLPTRVLIGLSELVRRFWYMAVALAVFGYWAFKRWLRDPHNARRFVRFQLHIPILGELVRNIVLTRILRTMASLLDSGISILKSLDLAKAAAANPLFRDLLEKVAMDVKEGKGFSRSLAQSEYIPPVVVGMISTGERTGTLPEVINRVASFYESETDSSIKNFFSAIEPLFIVVLGVMVGGIAISVLLPMFDMAQAIQ